MLALKIQLLSAGDKKLHSKKWGYKMSDLHCGILNMVETVQNQY